MRTVPLDDVADQPWRNGGGTTRELHRAAGWRLSIAAITADGPFSEFPGATRSLVVARGELHLDVGGRQLVLLPGELVLFGGEAPVLARPRGAVTVVNVVATTPAVVAVHADGYRGGAAEAVVDLTTLRTHLAVARGELPLVERAVVVVEEKDGHAVPRRRSGSRRSVDRLAVGRPRAVGGARRT